MEPNRASNQRTRVRTRSGTGLSLQGGCIERCPDGWEAREDRRAELGGPPPDGHRASWRCEAPAGILPPSAPPRRHRRCRAAAAVRAAGYGREPLALWLPPKAPGYPVPASGTPPWERALRHPNKHGWHQAWRQGCRCYYVAEVGGVSIAAICFNHYILNCCVGGVLARVWLEGSHWALSEKRDTTKREFTYPALVISVKVNLRRGVWPTG